MKDSVKYARWIKAEARRLGFHSCGISKAGFLEEEAPRLEHYLKNGHHGKMAYMENHFDKRLDPTLMVDGAKTVLSLAYNYYPEKRQQYEDAPILSKYAYGKDYHFVVKEHLAKLVAYIEDMIGPFNGRIFVDSAPVLERAWARKSGIGWVGKHGNLIIPQIGSFFFLAELIFDLELEEDNPMDEHCGTCTACIDACPTDAIVDSRIIDGSKCISYFTIELKELIPDEVKGKFQNRVFGCDICQDVCPWNRFSIANNEIAFQPKEEILNMSRKDWYDMTEDVFRFLFKDSAVKRTKYKGLRRNLEFLNP